MLTPEWQTELPVKIKNLVLEILLGGILLWMDNKTIKLLKSYFQFSLKKRQLMLTVSPQPFSHPFFFSLQTITNISARCCTTV